MADAFIDIPRMQLGGTAPFGRLSCEAGPRGGLVERIRIDEGSLLFKSDPLHNPVSFLLNGLLVMLRHAGAKTAKRIFVQPGERVGAWYLAGNSLALTVQYLGGGEARVSWSACELVRPFKGQSNAVTESAQIAAALVLIGVKRAFVG